ncbi:MAG: D-xylose ABC transporter substrate-binding protein [Spirochaetes bacterium]|jgi:D-xylose transport system substrate-binding protein|nr:D-xylose ABC transporter substrate-binding protein [Spirochaetota bacterium]
MLKNIKPFIYLLVLCGIVLSLLSCNRKSDPKTLKIGLSMDTLKEERWQKDRDIFMATVKSMGGEIIVQAAQGDDATQISQCENLITQGVDVLVIIPHNGEAMALAVKKAHEAGIPVLAYDRLIMNCDLDIYISFDNVKVGELQATEIVKLVPEGNYVYIGGAPTDNNALLFRQGAMNILQPLIKRGDINLVFDQFSDDWSASVAQKHMENALTKNDNNIDAVIAANDATAGGAVQALSEQGLVGKVPISGQDADIAGCMRIVEGTQSMTVYKSISAIATESAKVAMIMAEGRVVLTNNTVNNNKIDVPSLLLTPVAVTKDNMKEIVIKDGYHKLEDVYKNVPKNQWQN